VLLCLVVLLAVCCVSSIVVSSWLMHSSTWGWSGELLIAPIGAPR
jgi:hypothetical protein